MQNLKVLTSILGLQPYPDNEALDAEEDVLSPAVLEKSDSTLTQEKSEISPAADKVE